MNNKTDRFARLFEGGEAHLCQNGAVHFRGIFGETAEFEAFSAKITDMGFSVYFTRQEAGNRFADFYDKSTDTQIHLSFFACGGEITATVTQGEALAPKATEYERVVSPMITQVKQAYCKADCGMSYVIRLCDGRFVVIDGGFDEYEESERLLDILNEQNTVYKKPEIAAWFITHAHDDHFTAFVRLMEQYGDQVDIELVAYNWATNEMCSYLCDHTEVDRLTEKLKAKGCKIFTPHTGQRLCFADASFDILFACEDLLPDGVRGFNNTSTVMRMELDGRRVLWLGDNEGPAADVICARFPAESLKCELLQVGHHGYWGGSPELYRRADPSVLLWPCPDFWYHVIRDWSCNEFLVTSENIQKIFVSGRYTTVIDLDAPIPRLPAEPKYSAGDTIAEWDMSKFSRVIDLNWSCVNGGQTGYRTPSISFSEKGECVIDISEKTCLTELLRPGLLEDAPSYEMSLLGRVETCEQMGILYNDENPTVPNLENAMLFSPKQGRIDLKLTVSSETGTAALTVNGEAVDTALYAPAFRRGLYLYLKNAVIVIEKISVVR